jgi:hypothetical protein
MMLEQNKLECLILTIYREGTEPTQVGLLLASHPIAILWDLFSYIRHLQ